jgi:hypothetical protein
MPKNPLNPIPTIPMAKSYVKGYYEKRNGKLVYVSPYQNSKSKSPKAISTTQQADLPIARPPKPAFKENVGHVATKPVMLDQPSQESLNFILEVIIHVVKTIKSFEPGEIVRLAPVLLKAKAIIRELGYLDSGISANFDVPEAKKTRLSDGSMREAAAMSKELKRLSRRVNRATLREKIQKMSLLLQESI